MPANGRWDLIRGFKGLNRFFVCCYHLLTTIGHVSCLPCDILSFYGLKPSVKISSRHSNFYYYILFSLCLILVAAKSAEGVVYLQNFSFAFLLSYLYKFLYYNNNYYYYYFQLSTAALRLIVRSWLDVTTFDTRRLHACHHARAPSGGRWNCGRQMPGNFA